MLVFTVEHPSSTEIFSWDPKTGKQTLLHSTSHPKMSIVGSLSRKDVHGKDQYYLIILCTANYAWGSVLLIQ